MTINGDEALQRLHAVARAPINGIFDHQLGLGIVGGRLYQSERVGKAGCADRDSHFAWRTGIQFSSNHDRASASALRLARAPAMEDRRKLLPPGSTVLFREPTVWDRYRTWIISRYFDLHSASTAYHRFAG